MTESNPAIANLVQEDDAIGKDVQVDNPVVVYELQTLKDLLDENLALAFC